MKYLFLTLKIQDGEHEHTHRVLTTCHDKKNALKAADDYVSDYWGESDKQDDWYYFQGGTIAAKVQDVEVLSKFEYDLMSKIFSGEDRPGYFQIMQSGYEKGLQREEVEINCGANGKIMIHQDGDKLGFIVDVYGQTDEVNSMTIWEEDLIDDGNGTDIDDDGNCLYCGHKCWEDGEMCDEQQAGGFNDPTEAEIKAFKNAWGQSHGELCDALGLGKKTSDDIIMLDYFWIAEDKKWYNKEASLFTKREQEIANFLRHNQ